MRSRLRLALLTLLLGFCGAFAAATPAQALNCTQFKTAVENATNGQVITLDAGLTCNDTYDLPSNKNAPFAFTIRGGAGSTLDGTGKSIRIMTGSPTGGHVIDVTIRNLTFRNGSAGALALSGKVALTLDADRFFGNAVPVNGSGGAVNVNSTGSRTIEVLNSTFGSPTAPNSADEAGAIKISNLTGGPSIELVNDRFDHNSARFSGAASLTALDANATIRVARSTFFRNSATGGAGGAAIDGGNVLLERNAFVGNHVDLNKPGTVTAQGGGLFVKLLKTGFSLFQHDNRFDRNRINPGPETNRTAGGGGEWVAGYPTTIRRDRFTNNTIPGPAGTGEAEGGGLGVEGCSKVPFTKVRLEGVAAAGNVGGVGTKGAGAYVGGCGTGPIDLAVVNSTIAGNTTSGAGAVAGLFGGPDDKLTLRNSIVAGNIGGGLAGFGAGLVARFSDACRPGVLPGAGNICAKPRLANPVHGDVHETSVSPTINKGSNALVPSALKLDFDGNARVLNGRVDMGADEYKDKFAGVKVPTQTVTVKGGVAKVLVKCPAKVPSPCTGELGLSKKINGKRQGFGHQHFSIASGHAGQVPVTLNQSGLAAVQNAGSLAVRAKAVATDRIGTKRTTFGKVTLKS